MVQPVVCYNAGDADNGKSGFEEKHMIQKVNLKEHVNAIDRLFLYKRVGTLNNHMLNVLQAEHRTLDFHIHEFLMNCFTVLRANLILSLRTD